MAVSEKTSIKQLFQGMAGEGVEVLQGIVKSVGPLKIQIAGDEKLILSENSTYIPRHLTDYETKFECQNVIRKYPNGETTEDEIIYSGDLIIKNALQVGESVHVLSFNHGKQYYVLDRTVS